MLVFIPVMLLLFWQSRSQQKKQAAAVAALKKGDRVLTQSGIVGRLLGYEGKYAKLELPPSGVKITVLKSSLTGIDAEGQAAPADQTSKPAPEKP
jgi:preprotein translocase subunit YajC